MREIIDLGLREIMELEKTLANTKEMNDPRPHTTLQNIGKYQLNPSQPENRKKQKNSNTVIGIGNWKLQVELGLNGIIYYD